MPGLPCRGLPCRGLPCMGRPCRGRLPHNNTSVPAWVTLLHPALFTSSAPVLWCVSPAVTPRRAPHWESHEHGAVRRSSACLTVHVPYLCVFSPSYTKYLQEADASPHGSPSRKYKTGRVHLTAEYTARPAEPSQGVRFGVAERPLAPLGRAPRWASPRAAAPEHFRREQRVYPATSSKQISWDGRLCTEGVGVILGFT